MNARAEFARFWRGQQVAHADALAGIDHRNGRRAGMLLEQNVHLAGREGMLE